MTVGGSGAWAGATPRCVLVLASTYDTPAVARSCRAPSVDARFIRYAATLM